MKGFGRRLKRLIDESQYNQSQVARRVRVSSSAISQYINEQIVPSAEIVDRLARHLRTTPNYLIRGEEPKPAMLDDFAAMLEQARQSSVVRDDTATYGKRGGGMGGLSGLVAETAREEVGEVLRDGRIQEMLRGLAKVEAGRRYQIIELLTSTFRQLLNFDSQPK